MSISKALKRFLFIIFLSAFAVSKVSSGPLTIKVEYPREGAKIGPVKNSFVFGYVFPASATVMVNGSTVSVYRTGSYLAMIPFNPGTFQIKAQAELNGISTETVRTVSVSSPITPLSFEPLAIVQESVQPALNFTVTEGDIIPLCFIGSPNCKAEYRVKNFKNFHLKKEWFLMTESSSTAGLYEGDLIIHSEDKAETGLIEYRLTNSSGKSVQSVASGPIKISNKNDFAVAEVIVDEATLRTGPSANGDLMGYDLFLPKGVRLKVTGQIGNESRLKLSDSITSWTDEKNLKLLPEETPIPHVILETVRTKNVSTESADKERSAILICDLKEKVPYRASISNDLKSFTLTLFYTVSNIDRIRYDTQEATCSATTYWRMAGCPLGQTKETPFDIIRWSQSSNETVEIQCVLKKKIWGYDVRYEGNKLICEVIFLHPRKKFWSPLNGLTIAIDPGHSPETRDGGTISPQGIRESEVNFKIATCLKKKLEKAGANVILTREENESISLLDRGKKAWQLNADLFVSIHANALPDGMNPFEKHGFSIFYFQPQSFELAKTVHASYKKMIPIPDDGLYYKNLAVCRITQMPSILTESAYLILPEEEELLLSKEFQCRVSKAITKGIVQFVRTFNSN